MIALLFDIPIAFAFYAAAFWLMAGMTDWKSVLAVLAGGVVLTTLAVHPSMLPLHAGQPPFTHFVMALAGGFYSGTMVWILARVLRADGPGRWLIGFVGFIGAPLLMMA
jgi:hypothetical protein